MRPFVHRDRPTRIHDRAYAGWRVVLLVAGTEIRILSTGTQIRRLTLDPKYDHQPIG